MFSTLPKANFFVFLVIFILSFANTFNLDKSKILLFGTELSKQQILDYSKQFESADHNFRFNESGGKFSKSVENALEKEKLLSRINFSFPFVWEMVKNIAEEGFGKL